MEHGTPGKSRVPGGRPRSRGRPGGEFRRLALAFPCEVSGNGLGAVCDPSSEEAEVGARANAKGS